MTIKHDNRYGTTYIFEVVDKIPAGFEVWNIPEIANGEYIPICETIKGTYSIRVDTLKAVKLDKNEVAILHAAASAGVKTIKSAKSTLARTAKSGIMKRKQAFAEKALPILARITA